MIDPIRSIFKKSSALETYRLILIQECILGFFFTSKDFVAISAPHRHKLSIHILPSSEELNTNTLSPEDNGADLLPVPPNVPKVRDKFVRKLTEFSVISTWLRYLLFFKTNIKVVVMKCKSITVWLVVLQLHSCMWLSLAALCGRGHCWL